LEGGLVVKILCITPYYKPAYIYGGPTRSNSQLCEALVKLGADVTVLTTNANGTELLSVPLGRLTVVEDVDVYYYPLVRVFPHNFFYSPSLARACYQKVDQFDVVFLDTIFSHVMGTAVAACRKANVPYVVTLRSALLPWGLKHKELKKKMYLTLLGMNYLDHAAALHCTDQAESEAAKDLGLRSPTFVIPNGLDVNNFARLPARGTIRRRFNIPEQAKLLLFMGRLHIKKRPDIAIDALAATKLLPEETHLLVAGADEMQLAPKLRAQAQHLGCADRLHLVGLLKGDEILLALADADLLLMPSEPESENFGMSAVEAMAAGLPILVSEGVPVGYWAQSVGAGRVIPCKSEYFIKHTCDLLSSSNDLKAMGYKGQAFVRTKFNNVNVAQQMLEQFQAIIDTGRPLPIV
jgi:glycosyltransferase involved in cell wall biosynthesis